MLSVTAARSVPQAWIELCDSAITSRGSTLPSSARLTLCAVCYNDVDGAGWQRWALCSSAGLLQGGAGALCGARLGEGSGDGSSPALWGCAELVM